MLTYILHRLALLVPVLLGVSLLTFALVKQIPGDPVSQMIGVDQRTSPEQMVAIRRSYGLDQPLPVQYVKWLGHVVQGDLGQSIRSG